MKLNGPSIELKALERSVNEFETRFLGPHLAPPTLSAPSRNEILDVAAYVVLVHGALEDFAEGLALWVLSKSVASWTKQKKTSRSTISLLLYEKVPSDDALSASVFDRIRIALDEAKARMSKAVFDNHGIALNNLRTLFVPLGVNVPADPILTASLELLVTMRHQWAHQDRRFAKVVKSANDAQTTVSDCLILAKKLSTEVASVRP
jgi:hypothetical protein